MLLEQRARTRGLGALPAPEFILLRRQLRAPFSIGLFDLEFLRRVCRGGPQPPEGGKAKQAGDRGEQDTAVKHGGLRAKRNCRLSNTVHGKGSYTDRAGNLSLSCEPARTER